jgi:hypothetical protein
MHKVFHKFPTTFYFLHPAIESKMIQNPTNFLPIQKFCNRSQMLTTRCFSVTESTDTWTPTE